jgi:N-acetylglucosamine kinase-like BadF-type ATPase
MHVIGIDAGGTKTVCLLADDRGLIVSEGRGPGANLHVAGEHGVERVLHEVMEDAIGDRGVTPAAICLGIAGVDRDDEARTVRAIMHRIARQSRVLVVNDALIALVAGAQDAAGIVIIAGTGSIAYGRNQRGEVARAGGWGHMIGDEGSGYWIGRAAIRAVLRQADQRGQPTLLTRLLIEHFRVERAQDLIHEVYSGTLRASTIAALAQCVQTAFTSGDAVAIGILRGCADELESLALSVARRLELVGTRFPFVLAGGIYKSVPWLREELGRRFTLSAPGSQTDLLAIEPAVGAVRLAIQEATGGAHIPVYQPA